MVCSLQSFKFRQKESKKTTGDTSLQTGLNITPNQRFYVRRNTFDVSTDVNLGASSPKHGNNLREDQEVKKHTMSRSNSLYSQDQFDTNQTCSYDSVDSCTPKRNDNGSFEPSMALQCLAACLPKRIVLQAIEVVKNDSALDRYPSDSNDEEQKNRQLNESPYLTPIRRNIQKAESHCGKFYCALLFVDISGFTGNMERFAVHERGIEAFWRIISQYFSSLLKEIYNRGGDVECFAGDAMMVSFGVDTLSSHPVGKKVIDYCLQSKHGATANDAKLAAATMVAADAAAAMLRTLSPYSKTEKNFWEPGRHMELTLTLHGSIGAGRLTSLEIRQSFDDFKRGGKRWHYVCGPVIGQLAVAHSVSETSDCVLSRQASSYIGADEWGIPVADGMYRMKCPANLPPLISHQFSDCFPTMPNENEKITLTEWPAYEVSMLIKSSNFSKRELQRFEKEILSYVPDPMAKSFHQKSNNSPARPIPNPEDKKNIIDFKFSSSLSGPSLMWLGELKPAAVAFVKFDIGEINAPMKTMKNAFECVNLFKNASDSNAESDSSLNDSISTFDLDGFSSSYCNSPVPDICVDTPPSTKPSKFKTNISNEKKAQRQQKFVDIPQACLVAAKAVLEQNGHVNKILMDEKGLSLIYAFGTPGCTFEDNATRALRVGCSILSSLGAHDSRGQKSAGVLQINGTINAVNSVQLSGCTVNIGVATGLVCAALLGLKTVRCEYALIGDTVNLAARLASHASTNGYGMLACANTVASLSDKRPSLNEKHDEFEIEEVGSIRPKGKTTDVKIFEVKPAVQRDFSMGGTYPPPSPNGQFLNGMSPGQIRTKNILLGREKELKKIRLCISNSMKGYGAGIIVVQGEAGMGKSELLRKARRELMTSVYQRRGIRDSLPSPTEFDSIHSFDVTRGSMSNRRASSSSDGFGNGYLVIQVRCMAMDYFQPLFILSYIVQQILKNLLKPDAENCYSVERLKLVLSSSTMKLVPLLRRLRVKLAGEGTSLAEFNHLPASEVGKLIVTLCAALIEAAETRFEGTVVFIDDLHQCDGASLAALVDLFEAKHLQTHGVTDMLKLSVIVSSRSEEYYPEYQRKAYRRLNELSDGSLILDLLHNREANGLACVAFNTQALGPHLHETLMKICKGNPLFIKEVCKYLESQGQIEKVEMTRAELESLSSKSSTSLSQMGSNIRPSTKIFPGGHSNSENCNARPDGRRDSGCSAGTATSTHSSTKDGGNSAQKQVEAAAFSTNHPHKTPIMNLFPNINAAGPTKKSKTESGGEADDENDRKVTNVYSGSLTNDEVSNSEERGYRNGSQTSVVTLADRVILVAFLKTSALKSDVSDDGKLVEIPVSLSSIASASIDRLDNDKPQIVKVASVFNGPFTAEMFDQLKVLSRSSSSHLQELCTKQLLEANHGPNGIRYTFMHELVRVTAYNMLLRSDRRQMHYRIAEVLSNMPTDNPSQHHLFVVQHWLKVVENPPSSEELDEQYNGKEGWDKVLLKVLRSVIIAVREQLSFGSYNESEIHFERGRKILENLGKNCRASDECYVLEFRLILMGLEIFELTKGPGCNLIENLFTIAINISDKDCVKTKSLLSPSEVLQAKLYKANYMLYQEHTIRNDDINPRDNVLIPLYRDLLEDDDTSLLLRLEVVSILANDALQKGSLDMFDIFKNDIEKWKRRNCPELLCLSMHDPISMALGGQMVSDLMSLRFSEYVLSKRQFLESLSRRSVRPYHVWTTMSLVMQSACVTRELNDLQQMLDWISRAVPERFRGTGLPSHRMRLLVILNEVYSMAYKPNGICLTSFNNHDHFAWTNEWLSDGPSTPIRSRNRGQSWAALFSSSNKSDLTDKSPFNSSVSQGVPDPMKATAQKLSNEAQSIVVEQPSPIMCAIGYQIGFITDDEQLMEQSLQLWEETGIGMSWTSKNLISITTSFLFYARAEFRLRNIRKELEKKWKEEDEISSCYSMVPDVPGPDMPLNDFMPLSHGSFINMTDKPSHKLSLDPSKIEKIKTSRRKKWMNKIKSEESSFSSVNDYVDMEKEKLKADRWKQISERVTSIMPDLNMCVKNAITHKHDLLRIHVHMLYAELYLFLGDATAAGIFLQFVTEARTKYIHFSKHNVSDLEPLGTFDMAELLSIRVKAMMRESKPSWHRFSTSSIRSSVGVQRHRSLTRPDQRSSDPGANSRLVSNFLRRSSNSSTTSSASVGNQYEYRSFDNVAGRTRWSSRLSTIVSFRGRKKAGSFRRSADSGILTAPTLNPRFEEEEKEEGMAADSERNHSF